MPPCPHPAHEMRSTRDQLQVLATRTTVPVPALSDLLTRAMRTRAGRVGVLVSWAWIGLHFFAR